MHDQLKQITRIIVSTYKTHPEEKGWYIASEYKRLFWDNIPFTVDQKTIYNEKEGYGYLQNFPNIIFFDFVKHDSSFKSSKDEDIIKYKLQNLLDGVARLKNICKEFKGKIRLGFVGYNSYGLFYNVIHNSIPQSTNLSWKDIRKKGIYGKQPIYYEKNVDIYLLENITSKYYKTHPDATLKGWESFWYYDK